MAQSRTKKQEKKGAPKSATKKRKVAATSRSKTTAKAAEKKTPIKSKKAAKTTKKEAEKNPVSKVMKTKWVKDSKIARLRVPLARCFHSFDDKSFNFTTTEEIKVSNKFIDQDRAVRAIKVGLSIGKPGFNIYVAGQEGTGKNSVIKSFLQRTARKRKRPDDWVYVHNFEQTDSPMAINLPAEQGKVFKKEIEDVVEQLSNEVPEALQSEEYENNINHKINHYNEKKNKLYERLEKKAKKLLFALKTSKVGIVTIPICDGKELGEEAYNALPKRERNAIEKKRNEVEPMVIEFARAVRIIDQEMRNVLVEMQTSLGNFIIETAFDWIIRKYKSNERAANYIQSIRTHLLDSILEYIESMTEEEGKEGAGSGQVVAPTRPFSEYDVRLFIDNGKTAGAPVVIEDNPNYFNLFGKVERKFEYGAYVTELSTIKAGAIQRANGGYLVLEANDLFKNPVVWDTLKRMLRNRTCFIEEAGENYGLIATSGLSPEPIPLDVKVILLGGDDLYHILYDYDEDFRKIFKIKAEFDYRLTRNMRTIKGFVSFIATRCHNEKLRHFKPSGVAAMVEYSSRMVESQKHLSSSFGVLKDVIIEANFIAGEHHARHISRVHVEKALEERFSRSRLMNDHATEAILDDTIMIDTDETVVGQANGLAVYMAGQSTFGKPTRITSRVFKGKSGIVNIEREADMSGNSHTKGVMILSSIIAARFGATVPIGLSATVCFEQSYGGIDGDSASSTEYYTIVSAMADIPLRQDIAVTGSINQYGFIQAIGGVNEKIEGFFEVCKLRGLNGNQGVIVPRQNVDHLMLANEVIEAIRKKQFSVYAIDNVEQGIEILTGIEAGETDQEGRYTPGSIYRTIVDKLEQIHREEHADDDDEDTHDKEECDEKAS